MNKIEFESLLQKRFPNSNFTILQYTTKTGPGVIQCNKCGLVMSYKSIRTKLNKDKLCPRCETKYGSLFLQLCNDKNITILKWGDNIHLPCLLKCNKCNAEFQRDIANTCSREQLNCPYCSSKSPAHKYIDFNKRIETVFGKNEYQILETDFIGTDKIHIKHKCGFIYTTRIYDFLKSKGCPKCNVKLSKGEKAIINYLMEHKIPYEYQYSISNGQRFDFWINNQLAVEYNGEQHYYPTYGDEKLLETQNNDKKKQQYCIDHNIPLLIISYKQFDQISNILSSWIGSTTIPQGVEKD